MNWRDNAACIEIGPDIFYPGEGGTNRPAKAICATCPVTADCLTFALDNAETYGIWAGTSEMERRTIQRRRRAA